MTDGEKKILKVQQLIRLAVDAGASAEEARTVAMTVVRLIVNNGLQVIKPDKATPISRAKPWWVDADFRYIRTRFENTCLACRQVCPVNSYVAWFPARGIMHTACWEDKKKNP